MNDFSLIEKLKILMELISSSSLFLFCSIISLFLLLFLIICIVTNKKINKIIFAGVLTFILLIICICYWTTIMSILDKITDAIFMMIYFPTLPVYILIILISNVSFVISVINKKYSKFNKVLNIINNVILDMILIFVIELVTKNNVNLSTEINLYTDSILLVLLQLSMGIFISWILVNLFLSAHSKLKRYDKIEEFPKPEIIFD